MKKEYRQHTEKVLAGIKSAETLHDAKTTPSNNMGSQITDEIKIPNENRVLFDWFAFTLKEESPEKVIKMIGLDKLTFTESKGGGMGYKRTTRAGNIVIFFDGSENMGCHVSMTGQGCRQFEQLYPSPNRWKMFFILLNKLQANFTRLDIACDNVDGILDLNKLETCIELKQIRSRFRAGHKIENFTLSPNDETPQGKTIYIGSPASRLKFRFYDKAAQLKLQGHWVRAELQCMAERATEAINHILDGVEAGELAVGVLNNNFQPINLDDSNRTRCSVQDWWQEFTVITAKVKLTTAKAQKMISDVMHHVKKQYAPTFAMLKKFMGVVDFHDFVDDLITDGKERMKKQHEMIINCSKQIFNQPVTDLPF